MTLPPWKFSALRNVTGRDVGALAGTGHHHVGLVSRVERFAGAETTNISVVRLLQYYSTTGCRTGENVNGLFCLF